jgi:putative ABC transport system permease protein
MLKNYLKLHFRNIAAQRAYSAIEIFGLALGLACCVASITTSYLTALLLTGQLRWNAYKEGAEGCC